MGRRGRGTEEGIGLGEIKLSNSTHRQQYAPDGACGGIGDVDTLSMHHQALTKYGHGSVFVNIRNGKGTIIPRIAHYLNKITTKETAKVKAWSP